MFKLDNTQDLPNEYREVLDNSNLTLISEASGIISPHLLSAKAGRSYEYQGNGYYYINISLYFNDDYSECNVAIQPYAYENAPKKIIEPGKRRHAKIKTAKYLYLLKLLDHSDGLVDKNWDWWAVYKIKSSNKLNELLNELITYYPKFSEEINNTL